MKGAGTYPDHDGRGVGRMDYQYVRVRKAWRTIQVNL